jgi:hypothetical protein
MSISPETRAESITEVGDVAPLVAFSQRWCVLGS